MSVASDIGPIDGTPEATMAPSGRGAGPILLDGLPGPVDATARFVAQKLQLRRSDARDDPELEELVSIAVACARRAEDAVQQAREIHWMARRRMSIVAAVTGAGVLAASAVGIIDRYQATGDSRGTPTAFLSGPMFADVTGLSGQPSMAARPDPTTATATTEPDGAATPSADRARTGDMPRSTVADAPPAPVIAPASAAVAAATPVAPARSAAARSASAAGSAGLPPAAAGPAGVTASLPSPVAPAVPPSSPASSRPVSVAAAPLNPANASTETDGRTTSPSPPVTHPVAAAAPVTRAVEPPRTASADAPGSFASAGAMDESAQYGEGYSPTEVSPPPPPPPASRPVRRARRVARRPVYYAPQGPGVLLAQVVYGVRRNLYEIFH